MTIMTRRSPWPGGEVGVQEAHFFAEDFAADAAGHTTSGDAGVGDGADDEGLIHVAEIFGVVNFVAEFHR